MQPTLSEIQSIAEQAGEILSKHFKQRHTIHHKGRFDIVTEADHASEAVIIEAIRGRHPDHTIVTEESGHLAGNDGTWFIDPLDGTINYAHGMPLFCVSLAFAEQGLVQKGVIYDPWSKEMFSAERGQGATLNGERLETSEIGDLTHSLLVTGFPYHFHTTGDNLDNYGRLGRLTQGVRRLGSAALDLSYVAAGRLDGYWEMTINPWDIAAGTLIVEEAGGTVTNMAGERDYFKPPYSVVAANSSLHPAMLAALQQG